MKHNKSRTKNIKNQEVEIRALLTMRQRKKIFSKIRRLGGVAKISEKLEDIYYCAAKTKKFSEIEMNKVGSFSLRLRHLTRANKSHSNLNIKVITEHNDHRSWREHETRIEHIHEAKRILESAGFKPFFELKKIRHPFFLKQFTVLVEDIVGFGPVIEVEVMTNRRKAEQAKLQIVELLEDLGLASSQIVPKSITNLLMQKGAKF